MAAIETGLFADKIPFIKRGAGPRTAVVFFDANALFKRLDKASNPRGYADQVARLLPGDYRFTILGYGENPPETYDLGTIAGDLATVLRTEVGKPDVLVGVSFGGFVAQRFAAEHPDLLGKLVLLVSAHRFSDQGWRMMERQFKALEEANFPELVRDNALPFRRPWYNWLVRLRLWRERDRLASGFKDARSILREYRGIFSEDFLRNHEFTWRIKAENLVVGGTADQYFGAEPFEETARMIPAARLGLFAGETHMLPIERSRNVAQVLAGFLEPT